MLNVGYLTVLSFSFAESVLPDLPFSPVTLGCCCQLLSSSRRLSLFTFAADEKLRQTKSEGSDVSPAADQLTEDKHGRRPGFVSEYISAAAGRTSERYGSPLSGAR